MHAWESNMRVVARNTCLILHQIVDHEVFYGKTHAWESNMTIVAKNTCLILHHLVDHGVFCE